MFFFPISNFDSATFKVSCMMSRHSRRTMDQSRIFGTPPEPVFNMRGCCLSPNLLEELLFTQAASNERQTQKATAEQGIFKCGSLVGESYKYSVTFRL